MASTSYLKSMMERFKEDLAKRKPEAIKGYKPPPKRKVPKLDATPRRPTDRVH